MDPVGDAVRRIEELIRDLERLPGFGAAIARQSLMAAIYWLRA